MKKIILISLLLICSFANAAVSRLYVGEFDGQFMAGVDARFELGPIFVGGDVRTLISRAVVNEEEKVVGFMPDRTDYKTYAGLDLGTVEIEYSHTCYHRVISEADVMLYLDNVNPEDTNTISIKIKF